MRHAHCFGRLIPSESNDVMNLTSLSFSDGEPMPEKYAALKNDGPQATQPAENVNPSFSWSDAPAGTQSFVLICRDPDVPADRSQANQAGTIIAEDAPRTTIHHWIVVDIPASQADLDEGDYSLEDAANAGTAGRCGVSDIRKRSTAGAPQASDARYDGPAPPWNDKRLHHYEFTLYALSVPTLPLTFPFYADDVMAAMEGRVLASASMSGVYTLNPDLAPTQVGPTTAT
jgi:Raf kinase inhibitor-like YbhB/YbcL family protein